MPTPRTDKYIVTRERTSQLNPVYWNGLSQNSELVRKIYGLNLAHVFGVFEKERNFFFFYQKDWNRTASYISRRLLSEAAYFRRLARYNETAARRIEAFIGRIEKLDTAVQSWAGLLASADRCFQAWMNFDAPNVLGWYVAGDSFIRAVAARSGLSQREFDLVSLPPVKTRANQLEDDLARARLRMGRSRRSAANLAATLSRKYGWLPFGYDGPEYWDADNFLAKILAMNQNEARRHLAAATDDERKRRRQAAAAMRRLSPGTRRLIGIIHCLTLWTDDRKYYHFRLHYHYARIMREIAERTGFAYEDVKRLLNQELPLLAANPVAAQRLIRERERYPLAMLVSRGRLRLLDKRTTSRLVKAVKSVGDKREIKGQVACPGPLSRYTGRVRIVRQASEGAKVKPGDILVATMTTPDYVLAMRRAAAFVTDEGGLTCHAAIVAREMGKPCIIATRVATKILRDGQIAVVDTVSGSVKMKDDK